MLTTAQSEGRKGVRPAVKASPTDLHTRSGKAPADAQSRLARQQSAHGNQHVQRMLGRGVLQTKLTVSQPGDVYEQEADRMADAIMRMPGPAVSAQPPSRTSPLGVQRCSCGQSIRGPVAPPG